MNDEMRAVIEWLASPEGEAWSHDHTHELQHQGHRDGQMFTVEPPFREDDIDYDTAYSPFDEMLVNEYVEFEFWIYEPDTVKGLSSPA